MHAGVHHQAYGAQQGIVQVAEVLGRIVKQTHFLAQRFRIQGPAFRVGIVAAVFAEVRQVQFLHQGDVEMVAGLAFVQEQRRHARAAVLGRIVDDGPEHAGAGTVAGWGSVVVRCRGAAQLRFQAQVQLGLGHQREQLRQLGVEHVVELVVDGLHFLLRLERTELVLLRHPHGQAGRGAGIAQFRAQQFELVLDGRHFTQADGMDLLGVERRCGRVGDTGLIPGHAVRQFAEAGRGAAGRDVFLVQEGRQASQGRHHLVGHRAAVGSRQALLVRIGEGSGQLGDGRVEDIAFRRSAHQFLELGQGRYHDGLGLGHTLAHAHAHVGDGLVYPGRQLGYAAQVSIILGDGGDGLRRLAARIVGQHHGYAVHLVNRQQMLGEFLHRQQAVQFIGQDVVIDAVGPIQLGARNGGQLLAVLTVERELLGAHGGRDAHAQLVVVAVIAILRRTDGFEAGRRLIVGIGQGQQLLAYGGRAGGRHGQGGLGGRRGGVAGAQRCAGQGHGGGQRGKNEA